jgi:hypothetical protein
MAAQQVPAIHVQGLEKSYRKLHVLRGVDGGLWLGRGLLGAALTPTTVGCLDAGVCRAGWQFPPGEGRFRPRTVTVERYSLAAWERRWRNCLVGCWLPDRYPEHYPDRYPYPLS